MKIISLLITLSISIFLSAQEFKVSFTRETQNTKPDLVSFHEEFFSLDIDVKGGYLNARHNITLMKYGKDLDMVKSFQVSNGEKLYGPFQPLLKVHGGKLYLLYYKMPEDERVQLFCAEIDPASLQLSEPIELQDIKGNERTLKFYVRSVDYYDKNRVNRIGYYTDGPRGRQKTFFFESSPDDSKAFVVWSSGWDNKVFYSLLVYHTLQNKSFVSSLLKITPAGKTESKQIMIPGGEASSVFVLANPTTGKLLITGTYKENSDNLSGVFKQSFDSDNFKFDRVTKTPFSKDIVNLLEIDGWAYNKSKNYGLSEGIVLEPFILSDGTLNLVGEFKSKNSPGDKGGNYENTGSIFIARFDTEGTVFTRIPKFRIVTSGGFRDSYHVFEYQNKLVIFYNDNASSLKLDLSKKPVRSFNYANSIFVAATINEKGDFNRKIVADVDKDDYLADYKNMIPLSLSTYLISFRRKRAKTTDPLRWATIDIK